MTQPVQSASTNNAVWSLRSAAIVLTGMAITALVLGILHATGASPLSSLGLGTVLYGGPSAAIVSLALFFLSQKLNTPQTIHPQAPQMKPLASQPVADRPKASLVESPPKAVSINAPNPPAQQRNAKRVELGSDNQFSHNRTGCSIAALLFALSTEEASPAMINKILKDLDNSELSGLSRNDSAPDFEDAVCPAVFNERSRGKQRVMDREEIVGLDTPFSPRHQNPETLSYARGSPEWNSWISDFIKSESRSAVLIISGTSLGIRKFGDDIELFDSHGHVEHLKGKFLELNSKQATTAFVVRFEKDNPEAIFNFVERLAPIIAGEALNEYQRILELQVNLHTFR